MELKARIMEKKIQVAVIGMGYVGLPLSVAIAKSGYRVIGVDCNETWVQTINNGISNIIDVSSEILKEMVVQKRIRATSDYQEVQNAEAIIICVPTPLNEAKEPDLSYIIRAVEGIMPHIKKQILISLESTTYPGTTEEIIVKRIEEEKGWVAGEDFYVCYSPERVDPGNEVYGVENTPKVIGGSTKACMEVGTALYEQFLPEVVGVKSTKVAEMSKVLENTFRCVNIALVNEMTMMCQRMGIDIWEVIKGASTKPFGFMPFYPGPGVGGHCIPLDPLYLAWEAKKFNYFSRFIETASDINSNMPYYVVDQIIRLLSNQGKGLKDCKVLLLGMSYKRNIGDLRESPSLEVYELLKKRYASVSFYDPYVSEFKSESGVVKGIEFNEQTVSQMDLVVILTDHSQIDYKWLANHAPLIFDTRNACKEIEKDNIVKLGQTF